MLKLNKNGFSTLYLLIAVLVVVIIGASVFVYKNIKDKPAVVVEQNQQINTDEIKSNSDQTILLSGEFKDADAIHKGKGTAKIIESKTGPILIFEDDFSTTSGPDLFVYLSPNNAGEDLGEFASLGKLQKTDGYQIYSLPANYKDYKTVVVWCRAFSTTFTTASLATR